jgi:hypothetical protein
MVSFKSLVKAVVLVISGIAIVVVGGFMMGAIARLWTKDKKNNSSDLDDPKKAD